MVIAKLFRSLLFFVYDHTPNFFLGGGNMGHCLQQHLISIGGASGIEETSAMHQK